MSGPARRSFVCNRRAGHLFLVMTRDEIRAIKGEADAQALYQEVKVQDDFLGLARRYCHDADYRVARNVLWTLTKASDLELAQLQPMLQELIDLALMPGHSSVRRLVLNLIVRLQLSEEDLRTDFLDYCLERMVDVEELPGIQSLAMKLAHRMCAFYPELYDELIRTLKGMEIDFYKPAVKCVRRKILSNSVISPRTPYQHD